jgi:hypothetical protein
VIEAVGSSHAYTSILEAHNQRWLLALDVPTRLPPDSSLAPTSKHWRANRCASAPVFLYARAGLPRQPQ